MVEKTDKIWYNGEFVDWDDANTHLLTHTLHYGMGVFEGIRCYDTESGDSAVFRLQEHIRRLFDSAKICNMEIPYTQEEIVEACLNTLRENELSNGYIRPLVFYGAGEMGVLPADNPVEVAIITWPWGAYLGDEALEKGVAVKVSTFSRHYPNSMMTRGKIIGNYVNSILAKIEANQDGYHEGILTDTDGYISEGSGENLFMIRDEEIRTTSPSTILKGITRDTAIQIAEEFGYDVVEAKFTRDDLYIADELFFTGTAAEITPIRQVDKRDIADGTPGPITKKIQKRFFDIMEGKVDEYDDWLTYL